LVAHKIHDVGGMERAFYQLVRALHEDYRISVFSLQLAPELRPLVEWKRIWLPRRPIPLMFVLFYVLAGVRLAARRFDLVHTMGAIVPNRADLATVQFCQVAFVEQTGSLASDAPPLRRLNTSLFRTLAMAAERWSYRPERVRVLGAVSPGVARELERHFPAVPVTITPNGVDAERFRPDSDAGHALRRAADVDDGELVALFVGGDWDRKGLAAAVAGLARARRATGLALTLWVVGGGDEGRFRRLAAELGAAGSVRFFGPRSDAEHFYQAADVFVLPTTYETFSLAAHEAAAAGLPVVATRASGIEDLVGDDQAGLIVEPSGDAVAEALARLGHDPALRRRLGDEGRRRAAGLTWERSIESVAALYEGIAAAASVRNVEVVSQ
jgi:UDP-glucose:(heptosyl)LPS alpha-1,3-glucosyltransferase